MSRSWVFFIFIKLLASLVVVALLVEGLGWAVRDIPPSRHPLDKLVFALDNVTLNAPVILAGDSVTQDLVNTYGISRDENIANLTTNAASGMVGLLFILQRYLFNNSLPKHVVLAATPYFVGFVPEDGTYETYIRSVFTRDSERAWLREHELDDGGASWKPAILKLENAILDPVVGGLQTVPIKLPGKGYALRKDIAPESPGGNAVSQEELREYSKTEAQIGPVAEKAIRDICLLLAENDVVFHLLWAPIPKTIYVKWQQTEYLHRMETTILQAGGTDCAAIQLGDFNSTKSYPDHAFRDPNHLRRPGWVVAYGHAMAAYLEGLY
jgi:hypothetical protein